MNYQALNYSRGNDLRDLLDLMSNVVDINIGNLPSTDLCNLLLYGNSRFSFDTIVTLLACAHRLNRSGGTDLRSVKAGRAGYHIIKSTITFIKSTSRFKQIYVSVNSKPDHPLATRGIRTFSLPGGSGFRPIFFARGVGVSN